MKFSSCLLLLCSGLPAQTGTASLRGLVTDPSGSGIPNATVSVLDGATVAGTTSVVRTTKTDGLGRYQIQGLRPGPYVIQVAAKGFAVAATSGYQLNAGKPQTLDVRLQLGVEMQQITVDDTAKVAVDPAANAGALVLRGTDLEALSDNRDDLAAQLQALAGPAAGPNGGEIFIDGFTGGRLPPKNSILEVRVNQNPFSSQFDRPGGGRIEILTRPGSEDFHGELQFRFADAALNSRNPFSPTKPPYRRRQWEGNTSGPLGRKTSFFVDFERKDVSDNAFVNALTLDRNLAVIPLTQAIVAPATGSELNFRADRQLAHNHTLAVRYTYARDLDENQGVGGFSLASRAFHVPDNEDTWQFNETGVLNVHAINETRMRYRRQRTRQTGGSPLPTIDVLDSFTSGGAPQLDSYNNQDRYEFQNLTSLVHGAHVLRWGARVRAVSLSDLNTRNYAGTYTFNSLDNYRQTLLDQQRGLSPAQIRVAGGGPSQFSIAGGNPLASIRQFDLGFFAQQDWRARPNFTLSMGLRYEAQNHLRDWTDVGPRLAFAWGLGSPKGKAPKTVLRGGFGVFYDRFGEALTLEAQRLDGVRQQQFVVPFPDFYPAIPSLLTLANNLLPQAIRRVDSRLHAPTVYQGAFAVERQLPKNVVLSLTYTGTRGIHSLRSRNLNAQFPGGGYPNGSPDSIYYYEASGRYRQHQLIANVNAKVSTKLTFTGFYAWSRARSDTDGAATFPANPYDFSSEYGRAGFDIRHRFLLNGSAALPWGFRLSPFLVVNSGRPFNITLGRDLNGDTRFTDRPGFATDPGRPGAVSTAYGLFDTAPQFGQRLIPRNYGAGPGQVAVDLRLGKTLVFGEQAAASKGAKKKDGRDPMELTFTVSARNILNHPNLGLPVGTLTSPLFGQSTGLSGGGGGGAAGNRRLDLQVKFSF